MAENNFDENIQGDAAEQPQGESTLPWTLMLVFAFVALVAGIVLAYKELADFYQVF